MDAFREYLAAYIISNVIAVLTLIASIKKPMWARIFLALFFLWASYINSTTAIFSKEIYLTYGRLGALHLYRDFIYGFFSKHITVFVISIAVGQFLIFTGLLLKKCG